MISFQNPTMSLCHSLYQVITCQNLKHVSTNFAGRGLLDISGPIETSQWLKPHLMTNVRENSEACFCLACLNVVAQTTSLKNLMVIWFRPFIEFAPSLPCPIEGARVLLLVRPRVSHWATGPTHAKLVSLTSPRCSGWPAPMNTLKANNGPLGNVGCAGFNARLKSDLMLIFYFNSTNE